MENCNVLATFLLIFFGAGVWAHPLTPARLCVRQEVMNSCREMAIDLPEYYTCVEGRDMTDCVKKVHNGEADMTNLDSHGVYIAGKHFDLVPIAEEIINGAPYMYQGIALIKTTMNISSLSELRGKRACHTGAFRTAGWKIPLSVLLAQNITRYDCRGDLYVAESFFGDSCVPGQWSTDFMIDQTLKQRHSQLCAQCRNPKSCAADDLYAGYHGAIQCLLHDAGDVAFTKLPSLRKYLDSHPRAAQAMDLLCPNGSRMPSSAQEPCVWAHRPSNAFVFSANNTEEDNERLLTILAETQIRYPSPHVERPNWFYRSFLSSNESSELQAVPPERRTYDTYMGDFLSTIEKPNATCEDQRLKFCVISEEEKEKCEDFSLAVESRSMTYSVDCPLMASKAECVEALSEERADIIALDGGDIYKAGRQHNLRPVVAEVYNDTDATYYAVAVIRSASEVENLSELKGARSCHTGFGRTAGWVIPVGALLEKGLISANECDRAVGLANFFSDSCVPGANDTKYNPARARVDQLCNTCIGDPNGDHVCARDARERYNGYAGALRCLSDGAGDVAFVKHTTAIQYTDGKSDASWAEDLLSSDFQLLCSRGGRSPITDYLNCNLAKVPSHYVMTGGSKRSSVRFDIAAFLLHAAKQFGDESPLFKLFESYHGHADLLFKDATTYLKSAPVSATYMDVLGREFFKACEAVDKEVCEQQ